MGRAGEELLTSPAFATAREAELHGVRELERLGFTRIKFHRPVTLPGSALPHDLGQQSRTAGRFRFPVPTCQAGITGVRALRAGLPFLGFSERAKQRPRRRAGQFLRGLDRPCRPR